MEFRPSRFEILPPAIKNLLIINVLCFLAQQTLGGPATGFSIDDTFALHAWQSPLFRPWQLVTHLFMHGGFSHIFFNMLALWMFGSVLENVWGTKRFIIFYLICGLGAALIHLLFLSYEMIPILNDYAAVVQEQTAGRSNDALISFIARYDDIGFVNRGELIQALRMGPGNSMVSGKVMEAVTSFYEGRINSATLGASGAVFGILAAFGYLFPNTYLYIYMLFPIKAKWFVLIYGAFELYEGIRNSAGDNIAHWAHIGGAVVGLLIVITWNRTNRKTMY
ncbi:rhomboid family intramembrane serine protease [Sediminibacterium soli]|uniref:rhomboid family intramembrane serine protease n=1 Tax=Sediminibacterium soli TaxID=2698829 RepID=UPI00137B266C|nr:rhomboid family intramembrane serine protease [Sediminibacterium soli]NCI45101.1 rhomboid family intramembrane serine protease [Sediminibacterium soli]